MLRYYLLVLLLFCHEYMVEFSKSYLTDDSTKNLNEEVDMKILPSSIKPDFREIYKKCETIPSPPKLIFLEIQLLLI